MAAQLRTLLTLDLDAVDLRKGVSGLSALLAFVVFVAIFGTVGMVAALATLFVIMADDPGPIGGRGAGILIMTVAGSLIALVGVWAGSEHVLVSAALTFLVVALGTLAAGLGAGAATRGMLLAVWAVLAISFAGDTENALQLAIAFAGGGLIAAAIIWLRTRTEPEPSLETESEEATRTLDQIVRSPLGWFALLRAASAGLAMFLGAGLFPEHPSWAALTVILVMKPKAGEAIASGVLRSLGTLLGVIAAEALVFLSEGESVVVLIGFLFAAFGMGALQKVNYAVFVACLTALLVLADQLTAGTGEATATDRLLATLLGAVIAFVGIGIGRVIMGRPVVAAEPDPPSEDPHEDQTPG